MKKTYFREMALISQDGTTTVPYNGARLYVDSETGFSTIWAITVQGGYLPMAEYNNNEYAQKVFKLMSDYAAEGYLSYKFPEENGSLEQPEDHKEVQQ